MLDADVGYADEPVRGDWENGTSLFQREFYFNSYQIGFKLLETPAGSDIVKKPISNNYIEIFQKVCYIITNPTRVIITHSYAQISTLKEME